MKFEILITETLCKTVTVEAVDLIDALEQVEEKWNNEEYVLDADDFIGAMFEVK